MEGSYVCTVYCVAKSPVGLGILCYCVIPVLVGLCQVVGLICCTIEYMHGTYCMYVNVQCILYVHVRTYVRRMHVRTLCVLYMVLMDGGIS